MAQLNESEWASLSEKSTNGRKLFRKAAPVRWCFKLLNPIAPSWVGRAAFRIFRTTRRYDPPARELAWVRNARRLWLRSDDGWVSGWSWGSGPTVLLMHGWNGRASQMGALGVALAKAGFRAVAINAPGHGATFGRLSSLPQFAEAVELAADRLGPLHGVVAHSFGAAGTGWALGRGLRVGKLAFIAAPGDLHGYVGGFARLLGLTQRSLESMLGALEARFQVPWSDCRYATTLAADATPMLIVHDRLDDETHYGGALELQEAWSGSSLVTTEGLGHRRILRAPEVIDSVTAFMAATEPPRRVRRRPVWSGTRSGSQRPAQAL